ncbi:MAG: type II toxin-antitoxin system HipA family toxin [Coxiellaceae bacterium]|nr:type II toxin-antitoxin system HipA family toxin [Coxiellaceae bacterium]
MRSELEVSLYDQVIGHLISLEGGRNLFQFTREFLAQTNPPVLSQSFLDQQGKLIASIKPRQVKLPPFFSNLLPEGPMRRYLAGLANINPDHEFELLRVLGSDLPGAVIVSAKAQHNKFEIDANTAQEEEEALHFSLAGVQLKFSALMKNKKVTIPAKGIGGHWILKLPSQNFPFLPENEFAMMQLARLIGISVPDIQLVDISKIAGLPELGLMVGDKALMVKRFDRDGDKRIHMEDFAQVFNVFPHDKYQKVSYTNMASMVFTLMGHDGLVEFIRRLVFSIVIGNGDMHLKNWSLLYPDHYQAVLSPAYDLVSTIPYLPNDDLALSLVGKKKMLDIELQDFTRLSEKAALPKKVVLETVEQTVSNVREQWQLNQKSFALPADILKRISLHIDSVRF